MRHAAPMLDPVAALLDTWSTTLDDFEAALDHAEAQGRKASDTGEAIDLRGVFTPPASLPPFPIELADRARELVARTAVVQEHLLEASSAHRPTATGPSSGLRVARGRRSNVAPSFEALA